MFTLNHLSPLTRGVGLVVRVLHAVNYEEHSIHNTIYNELVDILTNAKLLTLLEIPPDTLGAVLQYLKI